MQDVYSPLIQAGGDGGWLRDVRGRSRAREEDDGQAGSGVQGKKIIYPVVEMIMYGK